MEYVDFVIFLKVRHDENMTVIMVSDDYYI